MVQQYGKLCCNKNKIKIVNMAIVITVKKKILLIVFGGSSQFLLHHGCECGQGVWKGATWIHYKNGTFIDFGCFLYCFLHLKKGCCQVADFYAIVLLLSMNYAAMVMTQRGIIIRLINSQKLNTLCNQLRRQNPWEINH